MKNSGNYMDYVYRIREGLQWELNEAGKVVVDVNNTGLINRMMQRFFQKPAVSHIELEGIGSYVFLCIDGNRSIYDISVLVRERYGNTAEPLYERLCVYMKQMEEAGFVCPATSERHR